VLEMPGYPLEAVKGRFQELLVDEQYQGKVDLALTLRLVLERRPRDRQQ
jgi:hypothetical protein